MLAVFLSRRIICRWATLLTLLVLAAPVWSGERDQVDLFLRLDGRGGADVALIGDFRSPGAREAADSLVEQSLARALGGTLHDVARDTEEGTLTARCEGAFRRRGWQVEGQIDPGPLVRLLRPLGVPWLTLNLTLPSAGFVHFPGAQRVVERGGIRYFYPVDIDAPATPVRFAFGYHPKQVLRRLGPLLALLLLPIGLTLGMRRRALRAAADPTVVWFGYWRFLRGIGLGAVPVWLIAAYLLGAEQPLAFVLGRGGRGLGADVWFAFFVLPPLLVATLCNLLSQPVFKRVRGMEWTQRELAGQSAGTLAATLLPWLLVLAGLNALTENAPRLGVAYVAAALVVRIACATWGQRVFGMAPSSLTAGELRDRVFALAEKAGVKVRQVYVLPGGKGRMANAFAMRGNNVLFTDYLLQHLSKREVDGIVAHELAHLQRRDLRRLSAAGALVVALAVAIGFGLQELGIAAFSSPTLMVAAISLSVFGVYFFSRRFERAADAGAVALTGDPEAMITALAKLMQLNTLPIDWGKWDERLLTHPSTLRRAQAIAVRSGISSERLQELLSLTGETEAERYPLPPAITAEEKVFSTAYKGATLTRIGWTLMAVIVLTPAVAASLAGLTVGAARWALYLAGLAATLGLYLAVANVAPLWGYRELERRLRAKIEAEGISVEAGCFVGFAPAAGPQLYENFYDWDVGYLFLVGDRLAYVGEQVRFALQREQTTAVRLGPSGPGWWRGERVYVSWSDAEQGTGGVFNLRPAEARSMRRLRRAARAFAKRLQAWREGAPAASEPPAVLADLAPPTMGEVTSTSPRSLAGAGALVRALLFAGVLGAGTAVLFGLSFALPDGEAWVALATALVAAVFQWAPYWRYREPTGG